MKIVYSHDIITPEEVVRILMLTGQSEAIFSEIVKNKEVMKKAGKLKIEVSDEQLQQFADNFRTLRGLRSAEEMLNFLKNAGLSEEDFETFCESSLLAAALKEHLADEKKIEEYFVNNRSDFDCARISMIIVKDENMANEIIIQVTEEGEDFHSLARKHSLDEATKHSGGYVGRISRQMFPPEVSAKVFSASADDLLGPFQTDVLFQLILIEEVIRARVDDNVKEAIKERIFREWISQFLKEGIKVTD